MGERAVRELGVIRSEIIAYPADWDRDGRAAGPIRNRLMLGRHPEIDLVVAFHDYIASSKGTRDMVRIAAGSGKLVELVTHDEVIFPYGR
jgi:hypothetical protein